MKKAYRRLAKKYHPDVNPGNKAGRGEVQGGHRRVRGALGPEAAQAVRRVRRRRAPLRVRREEGGGVPPLEAPRRAAGRHAVRLRRLPDGERRETTAPSTSGRSSGTCSAAAPGRAAACAAAAVPVARRRRRGRARDLAARRGARAPSATSASDGRTLRVKIPAGVTDGSQHPARRPGRPRRARRAGGRSLPARPAPRASARAARREGPLPRPAGDRAGGGARRGGAAADVRGAGSAARPGAARRAGRKLRLRGKGLPDVRGGARGDLYAVVQIVLPEPSDALARP